MRKTVLIIGASGDIGLTIAKERINKGNEVILHYHSNKSVLTALAKKTANEQILQIIQADLSKKQGIDHLLSQLVFNVDNIVFASGKTEFHLFQESSEEMMDKMLSLHIKAPWRITNHLLPVMIKKQSGKIVCITSIWGEVGASNEVLYSTVKGAQNTFVKALAKEVASSKIAVNAVSPGFINTKMNGSLTEEEKAEIYEGIPLKRAGTPNEIAKVVNFLLDNKGKSITGQIIPVTGGWMI